MPDLAIETHRLTKRFGDVLAVDAVDLRVKSGEIYGFLGLNGAGKTTTIRVLLGMIRAGEGDVKVLDQNVGPGGRGPWARVGHLVESPAAYPELTVRENLDIARRLHTIRDPKVVDKAIERLTLDSYADRKAGTLSSGNFQRLGLARALLHSPSLLILDEPTNALDPAGIVEIRELLISLAGENGTTIFMSSHILTEVDKLADRIGIIHRGRLIEELDAARLDEIRAHRLVINARDLGKAREALSGFEVTDLDDGRLAIKDRRAVTAPETIASILVNAGIPPTHLAVEQENLEEYFLKLTSDSSFRGSLLPPKQSHAPMKEIALGEGRRNDGIGPTMTNFFSALWAEALKARRSKVPLFTTLGFSIAPLIGGLMMIILKDPQAAKSMGLISAKAQLLVGVADWPTFFGILAQSIAVGGGILFALITAWVFGREFSDRTVKELLALPTSREAIVAAKYILLAAWTLALSLFIFGVGLVVGSLIMISGWSGELLRSAFMDMLGTAALTIALLPFVALFAGLGRGYLPAVGWTIFTMVLSQVAAITGWGDWFPWSVSALYSGMVGPRSEQLGIHSYVIVTATSILGLAATFTWWRYADQTR